MEDEGTGQFLSVEKIGPRRLRAAIWLFVIAGYFLLHAGSDPVCDYGEPPPRSSPDYWDWLAEEPDCEPGQFDELGYDFLDTTGLSKSTANTTGFFFLALTLFLVARYREHFPEKGLIFREPYRSRIHRMESLREEISSLDYYEEKTPEPEPENEEKWWKD